MDQNSIQATHKKLLEDFLSESVSLVNATSLENLSELGTPKSGIIVFESRVRLGLDISSFLPYLVSELFKFIPFDTVFKGRQSEQDYIAIHVRYRNFNTDRNPDFSLLDSDLQLLSSIFPNQEIRWFGESDGFELFLKNFSSREYMSVLSYQHSRDFSSAVKEVLGAKFYFQRYGGGMGTPVWFSDVPYLILSKDIPGTRLYNNGGRRLFSFSSKNQIHDLRILFPDRKISKRLIRP